MRFVLGLLSGLLGLLAGWFGLAFLVIALAGHDQDGGIAMAAVFQIGPLGGLVGLAAGVGLFLWKGRVRGPATPAGPAPTRTSRPFAVAVLAVTAGLVWWGWWEFVRSPYLGHGFMTLELQFRLPSGMALPASAADVRLAVEEDGQSAIPILPEGRWHGHDGDRPVILASASLSRKTSRRIVRLVMPDVPERVWWLDLPADPDPTPGFTPWRLATPAAAPAIEMNYRLGADR
ncbi:hypothetical protein EYW49_19540 [Siculibacillus lacustris]|uniref:Uncharacterized protein n=1 Tax=Siculibacillus lacustris TaxID=1549641 RepID=A0A4Q9VG13_9HYPH|nr:hypothetical protein [Siculibacillus lacustris]TBW33794.1 hypothetical protein EYW49_19540 [Siculibacillus lacustris]